MDITAIRSAPPRMMCAVKSLLGAWGARRQGIIIRKVTVLTNLSALTPHRVSRGTRGVYDVPNNPVKTDF